MGKVLKIREVGDPILEKECEEINIKNIDECIDGIVFLEKTKEKNGKIVAINRKKRE